MTIAIESEKPKKVKCQDCSAPFIQNIYYVTKEDEAWCVVWLERHHHSSKKEIFITATFRNWGDDASDPRKRITFSSRFGYGVKDQFTPAFSLIQESRNEKIFGKRLTREEALKHPLIDSFWYVIDEIWQDDPELSEWVAR